MTKSIYDQTRHPLLAGALARDGLIDKDIARALGIGLRTLNDWKKAHPEFVDALKEGKAEVDAKVEDSLLKRALGYDYEENEVSSDGNAKKVKKTKKHMAADVTACIFWLKNRQPNKWRDVNRQEITGPDGKPIQGQVISTHEQALVDKILEDPETREAARNLYRGALEQGVGGGRKE